MSNSSFTVDGVASGGTGTVTSVATTAPISGGTITTSGTISLAAASVTPGTYTNATVTVDAHGLVQGASSGSGGGGSVTDIATTSPILGGPITATGTLSLANATVTPGTYTNATIVVDAHGLVQNASNGSAGTGTVTSIVTTSPIQGGPITTTGTISMVASGVSAGSYTNASLTVNSYGLITAASSGSGGNGLVFIQKQTASNSTNLSFTGLSNIYSAYKLIINGYYATGTPYALVLLCSTNNGSSYDSGANYNWNYVRNGTPENYTGESYIQIYDDALTSISGGAWVEVNLYSPGSGYFAVSLTGWGGYSPGGFTAVNGGGNYTGGTAVNAIQLYTTAGVIGAGDFYLYGVVA